MRVGDAEVALIDPGAAREEARRILAGRRFRSEPVPRPLRGVLEWVGDRLNDLATFVADAVRPIPGPTWSALAAIALVIVVLLLARSVRRRDGRVRRRGPEARADRRAADDPDALEVAADEAERRGDLSMALRLRFRAGLLRLDGRGVIAFRPSLTTNEVRRLLGSETFEELAAVFEEVAYGEREAEPGEVAAARESWRCLLRDAERTRERKT